jgi:hypothetical protein
MSSVKMDRNSNSRGNVLFELEQELPKQQYKMEKRTEGY